MKRSAKLLSQLAFPLILVLVALFLCIANFIPGTFLSGWDTLHPEFDFRLNLLRTLFGVFRPEQGLGAVAAHAHMVELPRIAILYLLDFIFPLSSLRYLYIFMCLIAGPLGMYFFLERIILKKKLPSFLGALFYLLNLGTYQTFLVPFEMFTTLYATIPFIFWLFSEYLLKHKKRVIIFFSIAVILTSPAAYASTLWLVFFASLLVFFIPYVIINRHEKGILKRFLLLIAILLLLNIYWLLPNMYFAFTNGTAVSSANINKLFSDEAFLKNKEFGTIPDILTLKSFYFDWGVYNYQTRGFEQLTALFQQHLKNPFISAVGYFFSAAMIFGLVYSIKNARKYSASYILLLLFCLLFLVNINQPFTLLFTLLRDHAPLFKEAARFPDNKIFNVYILLSSIFVGYSFLFVMNRIKGKLSILFKSLLGITVSTLLIVYLLPAFQGFLIHPAMKVTIPLEYFSLFERLKNDSGRVANFPVASPWGWVYHDWYEGKAPSFQGAGFLYFGITQPLLERDFDRWNTLNEQYYREISHAVYSENLTELENVIDKYDIGSLLVDTSVINAGGDNKNLYYQELFAMMDDLSQKGVISKKENFGNFLTLYTLKKQTSILSTLPQVSKINSYKNPYYKDDLFDEFGPYVETSENADFPLASFTNNEFKVIANTLSTSNSEVKLELPKNNYKILKGNFRQDILPAAILATKSRDQKSENLKIQLYPSTPLFDNKSLIVPLRAEFNYPENKNYVLSINKDTYALSELQDNSPTALGSVFLNSSLNEVALFDMDENVNVYPVDQIPFSFGYCDGNNNSDLNILARPDSLVLERPQKQAVCINLPLNFVVSPEDESSTLITVSFTTKNSNLTACLADNNSTSCKQYLPINNFLEPTTIQFAINKSDLQSKKIILTVTKGDQKQTLDNLVITSQQAAAESLLDSSYFANIFPDKFSTISFPITKDKNYIAKANANSNFTSDCQSSQNKAKKEFSETTSAYRYTSTQGSYCDHLSFPNLPHSLSYLVYVKSANIEGLPMTMCITNYTSRKCDIYAKLTNSKEAATDVFLLPPSDPLGTGYDINLENIGIKATVGINDFYEVTFVPVPTSLLSQVQLGEIKNLDFPGKINSRTIFNPLFMTLDVSGPTLISMSYAYERGFSAYEVDCSGITCPLTYFIRPLFGNSLEHVKISSWKNGFIAPNAKTILIVYLPQYLEYLGIFAVAVFMTIIICYPIINHFLKNKLDDYFERKAEMLKKKMYMYLSR